MLMMIKKKHKKNQDVCTLEDHLRRWRRRAWAFLFKKEKEEKHVFQV
jgi:hypothetical protein